MHLCKRPLWLLATLLTVTSAAGAAPHDPDDASDDAKNRRYVLSADISSARVQAEGIRLLTGYDPDLGDCGDVQLGPLPEGMYTGEEAWLKLIEPVCGLIIRSDARSGETRVVADMSNCKCSFGFPRHVPLEPLRVVVTAPPLPALDEYATSPAIVIDRKRIDETGVASLPDLLRYLSQTAFHRGPGFRASGARYAELRGLGAAYTLVLINGRRAFGTAAELASSAVDLSVIPISAVEYVEILIDANSVSHGMDAIGGIVNIVLSQRIEPTSAVRYGAFRGGGAESHASISGGVLGERSRVSVFFDARRTDELPGRERDRWNNQDYTRFGGYDYRSRSASPPNVYSLDGRNLPGQAAPIAAAEWNAITGTFDFVEGRANRTSLRAYQGIVPSGSQATLVATGVTHVGSNKVSVELLAIQKENEIQLYPASVSGFTMSAQHPENPFGVPVGVDALLAGLPAQRHHVQMVSQRAVADLEGRFGDWAYNAFIVQVHEQANTRRRNVTNPVALAQGLHTNDWSNALSLHSTMRAVAIPEHFLMDTPVNRHAANATQLQASLSGSLLRLPAGDLTCKLGGEYRRERMNFATQVYGASRNVGSGFAQIRVPLIHSVMEVPATQEVSVVVGVRLDDYSDIGTVTRNKIGLDWQITDSLHGHASSSESFRPPSLAERYWPRFVVPTVIFDAKRAQTAPIDLTAGGSPDLRPTWGRSNSIGVTFESSGGLQLSAEYWQIKVRGHVTALTPVSLLAYEWSQPGRVVRAPVTIEDRNADRPGKLMGLDISQVNLGGATTQGVDLSLKRAFDTQFGRFSPQLLLTITDKFLYSDLPWHARMEDRVGVASESGTIPAQRAVASLGFENDSWRAYIGARVISSYRDRSPFNGEPMQRRVSGGAIWDFQVSRNVGRYLQLQLGAFNLLDSEPPFANVSGSLGFDASQWELAGRQIYGQLSARLP